MYASSFTSMSVVGCNFTKNQVLAGCPHCLPHMLSQGGSAHCALLGVTMTGAAELRLHTARRPACTEASQAALLVFGSFGWVHKLLACRIPHCHTPPHCQLSAHGGTRRPDPRISFFRQAAVTNAAGGAQGGALALSTGNLATLDTCAFSGNTAGQSGGALAVLGCAKSDAAF